jgi:M6 family metalloprotease-like protein
MKLRFIVVVLSLTVSLRLWAVSACPELRTRGVDYVPFYDPVTGNGTELPRMVDSKHYVPSDTEKVCVIMVNFLGGPSFDTTAYTPAYFTDLVFFDFPGANSMYNYYQEVSYGKLTTIGAVHGPFTLPESLLYYSKDSAGVVDRNLSWRLIRDACSAADGSINFVDYDYDADGMVDHIMVVHSARDQSSGANADSSIWPVRWGDNLDLGPFDGREVDWGTIVSYSCQVGTFAHEFCHDIGMPDLYDYDNGFIDVHDNNDYPVEEWCLMASGNWMPDFVGTDGAGPSHICGFLKWQLGWIDPIVLNKDTTGVVVREIELHDSESLYRIPISANEFFLIENRNSASLAQYDHWSRDYSGIGGPLMQRRDPGLLIMHIDMNLWNPPETLYFNNGFPTRPHYGTWVEDPAENLMNFPYETKYYAAYANEDGETDFTPYTMPNSGGYYGPSGVSITNISISGAVMTFNLDMNKGEAIQLTSCNYDIIAHQWSPEGGWIIYDHLGEGGLYKIPSGGGKDILIVNDIPPTYFESPQWSPDGNWIAYTKWDTTTQIEQIYKVSSSGGPQVRLTSSLYHSKFAPVWSPDGNWIAYKRTDIEEVFNRCEIYKISSSGGAEIPIAMLTDTVYSDQCSGPQWSSDGAWLAYHRLDTTGCHQIYKVSSSGGTEIALTNNPYSHEWPQWSPDGNWITYVRLDILSPGSEICKVPASGGSEIRLATAHWWYEAPQWSPDGNWIVYMFLDSVAYQLGVVSSSGGSEIDLTFYPDGYNYEIPQWSPDGNWITYQKQGALGYYQIWAIPFFVTGVEESSPTEKPIGESLLLSCYPNPFNHFSIIKYELPSSGAITLKVYNIAGQLVRTLVDAPKMAGCYQITWDGRGNNGRKVASGIYFYRLQAEEFITTKKITLLK